ncbi:hypothetical protein MRB53_042294 [Persea americana]|nr:hypothetical protein MRB53_042294 [Persea americana]
MERSDSAKSGLGPHQRDDEVLWGAPIPENDELPVQPPRAKIIDPPRSYNSPSNAAINDLHPPTTRKVRSKEEVMWMMQPPPMPEVMSGKAASLLGVIVGVVVHQQDLQHKFRHARLMRRRRRYLRAVTEQSDQHQNHMAIFSQYQTRLRSSVVILCLDEIHKTKLCLFANLHLLCHPLIELDLDHLDDLNSTHSFR